MQNFFYMRWDESSKRMRLHMLAARSNGRLSHMLQLIPVHNYVSIDGRAQTIDLKDDKRFMPYNMVSNGRESVKFHDGVTELCPTDKEKVKSLKKVQGRKKTIKSLKKVQG